MEKTELRMTFRAVRGLTLIKHDIQRVRIPGERVCAAHIPAEWETEREENVYEKKFAINAVDFSGDIAELRVAKMKWMRFR